MTNEELRQTNREMIKYIRDDLDDFFENLRDRCTSLSFNFEDSQPELMTVHVNPDGSIGDVKYDS